tara:strand:- start:1053 stop:1754 length:702 start_codon:yes stop_codon:yes gene_type:complete
MTVKSKFYLLGTVETNNSTTQFLELTNISTDYAVLRIVFNGMIDHSGGGTTNVASGQWQQGVSIGMQGAWTGGPNASAMKYRNMQCHQASNSTNWQTAIGCAHQSYSVTPYGEIGRQYYHSGNLDGTERFTIEGIVVQPGNNQSKQILWKGSGTSPASSAQGTSYSGSGWTGCTKLDAQNSASAQRAMAPMDSIRIGAGWDSAGTPKTLGIYSSLAVYGEGWTSDVQTGNDWS